MGALKILLARQKKAGESKALVEKGLMYVKAWVNHRATKNTLVDSRATHNFMIEVEAKRLNIS